MLKIIDTKFRNFTKKIIDFLSKIMILLFFCILISSSAKFTGKALADALENSKKKIHIVYSFENFNFSESTFNLKYEDTAFKFKNFFNKNYFNFDVIFTDKLELITEKSDINDLMVLDFEFLKTSLKDKFDKIEFSPLKNYLILKQEDKYLYIAVAQNTQYKNLVYKFILNLILFLN